MRGNSMQSKYYSIIVTIFMIGFVQFNLSGADKKLAQTGFQFLSIASDARAAAMAGAMTTVKGYSNSLFFNPAGMAELSSTFDVNLSQNTWIADIKHNAVSMAISPMNGRYGVFGFSLVSVDYGDIQGTIVSGNERGYIDTEIFKPTAMAIGIGYARALTNAFSVGGHVKQTYQYLGKSVIPESDTTNKVSKNVANAVAFDFGTIYVTEWNGFSFGMSVRNFSEEIKFDSETFQLPLTFKIGASIDAFNLLANRPAGQSLLISVDAIHPRSYPERLNIGFEYTLLDMLALRWGYLYNYDERNITAGFGVYKKIQQIHIGIDYAYTPFGVFDQVQRFSLQLAF